MQDLQSERRKKSQDLGLGSERSMKKIRSTSNSSKKLRARSRRGKASRSSTRASSVASSADFSEASEALQLQRDSDFSQGATTDGKCLYRLISFDFLLKDYANPARCIHVVAMTRQLTWSSAMH